MHVMCKVFLPYTTTSLWNCWSTSSASVYNHRCSSWEYIALLLCFCTHCMYTWQNRTGVYSSMGEWIVPCLRFNVLYVKHCISFSNRGLLQASHSVAIHHLPAAGIALEIPECYLDAKWSFCFPSCINGGFSHPTCMCGGFSECVCMGLSWEIMNSVRGGLHQHG